MKYILLSISMLLAHAQLHAQTNDSANSKKVAPYVERMPAAGYSINDYLAKHLNYPKKARKEDIEGRVVVKFIVNEDGSISDVTVARGIHHLLDAEAVRVVREMPKWSTPGMQNGKTVKVFYTLPIVFKLEDNDPPKQGEPKWKKK